jgi:prepilin-type N-terminal cleavage/methylation domain-containing protein/prepilin-type processing-associated H-X9-DG protein
MSQNPPAHRGRTSPARTTVAAFTLIELLVVIAIIAILAAILFPVFSQAREKSRQASCLSNTKQLGLAMIQYTTDFDETYPRADYFGPPCPIPGAPGTATGANCNRINHFHWWVWLYPYTKNTDILFCPSRPIGDFDFLDPVTNLHYANLWRNSSQVANGYLLNLSLTGATNSATAANPSAPTGPGSFRNSWAGGTEAGVRSTADTLLFMEGQGYFIPTADVDVSSNTATSYPTASKNYFYQVFYRVPNATASAAPAGYNPEGNGFKLERVAAPHNGGVNISFADGHSKWMNVKTFLSNCPEKNGAGGYDMRIPALTAGNSFGNTTPNLAGLDRDYPMWNLYRN